MARASFALLRNGLILLTFVGMALMTGSCADGLVGGTDDVATVGKRDGEKGRPPSVSTPVIHAVNVRAAEPADRTAWDGSQGSIQYDPTGLGITNYLGVNSVNGAPTEPEEFWGCPAESGNCLAIEMEVSGFETGDLLSVRVTPINREPEFCAGTAFFGELTASCAHDGSFGDDRRLASLFLQYRATPYVAFDAMEDLGNGRRRFVFLWQGQHTIGKGPGDATYSAVFYPSDHEPGSEPDWFRFQPHRLGSSGSSLDAVDCVFADGTSTCAAPFASPFAASGANALANLQLCAVRSTSSSGRGKNKTTATRTQLRVSTNLEADPNRQWPVIVFESEAGAKGIVTSSRYLEDSLPDPEAAYTFKVIEIEWYDAGSAAADYTLSVAQPAVTSTIGEFADCASEF